MITARPQKNLKTAKEYFRKHLAKGDYHSEGQTVQGWWFGKGAARLGLDGSEPVTQMAYERLCDNLHPVTGEKLTVRQRQADRRVCYDFVVSAPKSISIMALTMGDGRLITAHSEACVVAMTRLEEVASTRVRRNGQDGERHTGEIVAAVFRHDTSRSQDPQLHTHFVAFNATWDRDEQRWKALQTTRMFEDMTFFTEVYRSELAKRLLGLGYGLRESEHGFEIEGVSQDIVERFSKRRRAILEAEPKAIAQLNARLLRELEEAVNNSKTPKARQAAEAKLREFVPITQLTGSGRSTVAHATRPKKSDRFSAEEIVANQRGRLSEEELAQLRSLIVSGSGPMQPKQVVPAISAAEAIDYAREHLFERHSVVRTKRLIATALAYARYQVSIVDLEAALAARQEFIEVGETLTTREALGQEQRLISLVNQGMGQFGPLNPAFTGTPEFNEEQRLALQRILRSPDQVIGLRGGAGTGKTRLLHEVIRGIEERQRVIVLAPTTAGVQALRKEGVERAATVQRFLADELFQQAAKGSILVVDEAGLLSTKDLLDLEEWTCAHRTRLVLCGDIRQHSSVEAGDALRLVEQRSSLRMIAINGIQRQIDREYRLAVAELAKGKGLAGLARLERLGAVHEIKEEDRYQFLAEDYVASVQAGKSALVVSPTWREIEYVTTAVRDRLKSEKLLETQETPVTTHHALKWTRAEKRNLRNYQAGLVLCFYKGTSQFASGDWAEVVQVTDDVLHTRKQDGILVQVSKKQAGCFDVARRETLPVAAQDHLLIQGNRKANNLFNGQIVTVKEVQANGQINLTNGRRIPADFRAFTYGYATTSHAAQGRAADHVYVAVDSHSIRAANMNQFYVSASRGCEKVEVFTDDLMFLRQAVTQPAARLSAMELMERADAGPRKSLELRPGVKLRLAS